MATLQGRVALPAKPLERMAANAGRRSHPSRGAPKRASAGAAALPPAAAAPLTNQLRRIGDRFDAMLAAAEQGVPCAAKYDELEAEARAIARDLVAAFRGPRA